MPGSSIASSNSVDSMSTRLMRMQQMTRYVSMKSSIYTALTSSSRRVAYCCHFIAGHQPAIHKESLMPTSIQEVAFSSPPKILQFGPKVASTLANHSPRPSKRVTRCSMMTTAKRLYLSLPMNFLLASPPLTDRAGSVQSQHGMSVALSWQPMRLNKKLHRKCNHCQSKFWQT